MSADLESPHASPVTPSRRSLRSRAVMGPVAFSVMVSIGAASCGTTDEASRETLPPLITTTSTPEPVVDDPNAGKTEFYEIKSGDSIARIASAFGVPASEIIRINNIENPDAIQVGQIIQIPTDVVLVESLPEATTSTTVPE